jgi:hypothetical protein
VCIFLLITGILLNLPSIARDLLEDRLRAITDAIVARRSDSEDVLVSDTPPVVFPLLIAPTAAMPTHHPAQDSMHETQTIGDELGLFPLLACARTKADLEFYRNAPFARQLCLVWH